MDESIGVENNSHFLKKIDLKMKEYEILRQEMLESIKSRNQIVAFGLSTVAFLIGAAATLIGGGIYPTLITVILDYLLPTFTCFIILTWLGEVERMMRAGWHVHEMEKAINNEFNDRILTWEIHRRAHKIQTSYAYISTIILFTGIAIITPMIHNFQIRPEPVRNLNLFYGIIMGSSTMLFIWFRYRHFKNYPINQANVLDKGVTYVSNS